MAHPNDRKSSNEHEWVVVDGDVATIGITEFAQDQLGEVVYVDMPSAGDSVSAGETFGEIESVKAVSSLYSPVSGEVVAVNKELPDHLEWLGEGPFTKAWMLKVKVTAHSPDLMNTAAYDAHCKAEG